MTQNELQESRKEQSFRRASSRAWKTEELAITVISDLIPYPTSVPKH